MFISRQKENVDIILTPVVNLLQFQKAISYHPIGPTGENLVRGGGHTTGAPACETTAKRFDPEEAFLVYGGKEPKKGVKYDGRAQMVVFMEALHRPANSLGICIQTTAWFSLDYMGLRKMAELYSAATGWETSVEDLKRITARQLNLEKAFNLRHTNFDRRDDLPTPRDLTEPIPSGNLAGWKIDPAKYNRMLDEYYDLRGWDRETSYPTRKTLEDFGARRCGQ